MKFDSYSRFLKSSLYQECMLAEVEGRSLPDPYQIPCSPAPSKHSASSERSGLSTPKMVPPPPAGKNLDLVHRASFRCHVLSDDSLAAR